jgi:hypothetical protein
MLEVNF